MSTKISIAGGTFEYERIDPLPECACHNPIILMRCLDQNGKSLCNAIENVANKIMCREALRNERDAIWLEELADNPSLVQIVQFPVTMPVWGVPEPKHSLFCSLLSPSLDLNTHNSNNNLKI